MATTYILNEGQTTYTSSPGTYSNSQTNTSINPVIVNEGLSSNYGNITNYEIRNDDSSNSLHVSSVYNRVLPDNTTVLSALSNAENTAGYRLKLPSGTPLTMDSVYDYFVVIYSTEDFDLSNINNHKNKHHIAKITQQIRIDSDNDGIEFSPKLSYELSKDTKFAIYKGPHIINDTAVVAVSYGLLGNGSTDSDRRYDTYAVLSTPTFYLFNDRLDTNNQLDYNTKYKLHRNWEDSNGATDTSRSIFLTQSMAGSIIQDKSPYTYNVSLVDNLLTKDRTIADVGTTSEEYNNTSFLDMSDSYTFNHLTWADTFRNGKRASDNMTGSAANRNGPSRYINHIASPEKTNIFPFLIDMNIFTTVSKSGTYGECRFADPNKIMNKKLKHYDSFKVRNILFNESLINEADAKLPGLAYYESANVVQIRGLESEEVLDYISGEPNYLEVSSDNFEIIKIGK